MKHFTLEDDDYLYCNKCEETAILHEVFVVANAVTFFELEGSSLRKPNTIDIKHDSPIYLKCSNCYCVEDISLKNDLNGAMFK